MIGGGDDGNWGAELWGWGCRGGRGERDRRKERKSFFVFVFFPCPINCADLGGTAPAPLVPASPTSGHTQGSFRIAAPPPEVHRRREIVGRLPSEGYTALLPSQFGGVQ